MHKLAHRSQAPRLELQAKKELLNGCASDFRAGPLSAQNPLILTGVFTFSFGTSRDFAKRQDKVLAAIGLVILG
jgi:hypothetical protein